MYYKDWDMWFSWRLPVGWSGPHLLFACLHFPGLKSCDLHTTILPAPSEYMIFSRLIQHTLCGTHPTPEAVPSSKLVETALHCWKIINEPPFSERYEILPRKVRHSDRISLRNKMIGKDSGNCGHEFQNGDLVEDHKILLLLFYICPMWVTVQPCARCDKDLP